MTSGKTVSFSSLPTASEQRGLRNRIGLWGWIFVLALAMPSAAESGDYRIRPGDLLEITVWREPDLSGTHRVGADGTLQHVLAGAMTVEGATLGEAGAALGERLESEFLREARVAVTLVESTHRQASVLGDVPAPGRYPVDESTRVLDLLLAATVVRAGGATLLRFETAPASGEVTEPSERFPVDVAALLQGRSFEDNHRVLPGDVLVVRSAPGEVGSGPAALEPVRVVGAVETPGGYDLPEAATLLDAVLAAGGLAEYAAGNRARLIRGQGDARTETKVRLVDLLKGRESQENLDLQPGDLLVVPESFF
jgi:polysaccharide export outer membrane protein